MVLTDLTDWCCQFRFPTAAPHRTVQAVLPHQMRCTTFDALCGVRQGRALNPLFLAVPFPQRPAHFHLVVVLRLLEHMRVVAEAEVPRPPFSARFRP